MRNGILIITYFFGMKKIVAIFGLFWGLLGAENTWGQGSVDINVGGPTNLSSLITPSSTASSLTRSLDVPVNLYTGKPQISVPLYTLSGHQLSLPITLSYDAGGIRTEDKASWVGLGWSLSAGGCITRSLRSLPDEVPGWGYMSRAARDKIKSYLVLPGSSGPMTEAEKIHYLDRVVEASSGAPTDCEPDLFSVSTPWWSGQFLFDLDSQIITIPYSSVKIEGPPNLNVIYITTPEGIKMTFGGSYIGYSESVSSEINSIFLNTPTAWHLSKVENLLTKDTLLFEYTGHETGIVSSGKRYSKKIRHRCVGYPDGGFEDGALGVIDNDQINTTWILSTIRSAQGSAHFYWHPPAIGVLPEQNLTSDGLLDSLLVRDKANQIVKQYHFGYDPDTLGILKRLTEKLQNCAMPPYEFEYHDPSPIPFHQQDHWGFPNSNDNITTLIPPYRGILLTTAAIGGGIRLDIAGANRRTDSVKVLNRSLRKIKYPTGGYTELEMEAHKYSVVRGMTDSMYLECFPTIDPYASPPILIEAESEVFISPEGSSDDADFTFRPPNFGWSTVPYRVIVKLRTRRCVSSPSDPVFAESGITITRRFISPGGALGPVEPFRTWHCSLSSFPSDPEYSGCDIDEDICLDLNSNYEYKFSTLVTASCPARAYVSLETKPSLGTERIAGGLRIKRMKHYDGVSLNPQITRYDYTYQDTAGVVKSSGDLYARYVYNSLVATPTHLALPSGGGTISTYCFNQMFSSQSLFPLNTTQGSHVGYSHVTVYQGENGENGKTEHVFTCMKRELGNFRDIVYTRYPFAQYRSQDDKRGLLLQQTIYKYEAGAFQKVKEIKNTYSLHSTTGSLGESIGLKIVIIAERIPGTPFPKSSDDDYVVQDYIYRSDWYYLRSTVERSYDQNNDSLFVEQETRYTYGNPLHQKPTQMRTSTSKPGRFLMTETRYNSDFVRPAASLPGDSILVALDWLKANHIHALPMEVIQYETSPDRLISAQLNIYKLVGLRSATLPSLVLARNYTFDFAGGATGPAAARCNIVGTTPPSLTRLFNIRLGYKLDTEFLAYNREANITHFRKANH
ncbi:MAG: hypothetical protein EAZ57_09130, partial [Cytophagales bacterium]